MVKATKKILLVGPQQSGKTSIANFINDPSQSEIGRKDGKYDLTAGCRILKCEIGGTPVELWDVSGDAQYEGCWPAIVQGIGDVSSSTAAASSAGTKHPRNAGENNKVDGVVLVFNPDMPSHEDEVILYYDHFVRNRGLRDRNCMVLIHTGDPPVSFRSRTPKKLERCHVHNTTFSTTGEVHRHFCDFVKQLR